MASNSFRDSINSLGWGRRDEPVNTTQNSGLLSSIRNLNPFGDSGYVRLPTHEGPGAPLPQPTRREEEEGWFARTSIVSLSVLPPRCLFYISYNIAIIVLQRNYARIIFVSHHGTPAAGPVHAGFSSKLSSYACDVPCDPSCHFRRRMGPKCTALRVYHANASFLSLVSRWDRLLVFGACNLAALACFVICFTLFPVLSIRPRKFVILWVSSFSTCQILRLLRLSLPIFLLHVL